MKPVGFCGVLFVMENRSGATII